MKKVMKAIIVSAMILSLFIQNVFAAGYTLNSIDNYVGKLVADLDNCFYQKNSSTSYNPYSKRYFNGGKQCVGYAVARTEEKLKVSGIPSGGSTGEAAKNIPSHYTSSKYNGKTVTSYMTKVTYTIQAYQNDGGKNLTSNCWASFNSSSVYGHVIYVEEVVNKGGTTYVYYTEGGGSLSPGVLRKKTLSDFIKLYKGYVGCVAFTASNVSEPKETICASHTYDSFGYCTKCKAEFPISVSSITQTTFYAVKDDVPVRARPYSPDAILKNLKKGTAVTVVGSGKNSVGNLWYKLDDGNWIFSDNLTKVTPTPAVSLTATVKYNANGGSGAPSSHVATKDSSGVARFNLSTTKPTRSGYTFLGWRLENSTAYSVDTPGQSIAIELGTTSDTTLTYYAQWSSATAPAANTVTVKFDANGGTGAPPSQTGKRDANGLAIIQIPNVSLTRAGYRFEGWNHITGPYTSERLLPGQNVFTRSGEGDTVVLTAEWSAGSGVDAGKPHTITVYFDANGGTGGPPSQTVTGPANGSAVFTWPQGPTMPGYRFVGWKYSKYDSATIVPAGNTTSSYWLNPEITSETYVAVWESN